ncbi:MAG: cysteine desulfuration protein SufE [Blastopirellula sp.]|nr:cysteine desulfuration protein SufE [Blastopirellula sp.]
MGSAERERVSATTSLEELYEEFDDLGDWDDQCDYLIDLGFDLPQLPDEAKCEENRVHGCQSQVWLIGRRSEETPEKLEFLANSDAIIVNGLIAVLLAMYTQRTAEEILSTDAESVFARLGLQRHLSPQRRNGLFGMVERIRKLATEMSA